MRYWVYINEKVVGPYAEDSLAEIEGFTPDTLICAEEVAPGGRQEWVKASSVFEFDEISQTVSQDSPISSTSEADSYSAYEEQTAAGDSASQILLRKIEQLTQEIEGMKKKLDQSVSASNAAQQAAAQLLQSLQTPISTQTAETAISEQTTHTQETNDDEPVTDTQSLYKHAEEMVTHASLPKQNSSTDFIDVIEATEHQPIDNAEEKDGEELVLRSALDSLYNESKEQTEDEKENTFQDLLSPIPFITAADEVVQPQPATTRQPEQQVEKEPLLPEQESPSTSESLTKEQREEVIDDIITPQPQGEDFIAQALGQAQQDNATAQNTNEAAQTEQASQPFTADVPALDLSDQPQLSVAGDTDSLNKKVADDPIVQDDILQADQFQLPGTAQLKAMNPQEEEQPLQEQDTASIKELVPGKSLEAEQEEGLISQADLEEAFTDRHTESDIPFAQPGQPLQEAKQPLPKGEGFYQPKDMTEIHLQEGSTYLISDFIPPAAMGANSSTAPAPAEQTKPLAEDDLEEVVPVSKEKEEVVESKIALENTIKSKRGATMDIKTAPMVKNPADSDRLDLTDSDLDLDAQHDLQSANYKSSGSKLTKVVLLSALSVLFLGIIFIMLAFLDLVPQEINPLKMGNAPVETMQGAEVSELLELQEPEPQPEQEVTQPEQEPADTPLLSQVKNHVLPNGQTLEQLINSRHPEQVNMIEWTLNTAVEPDNYSVLVKVPPENPQSFKISYRFNYNAVTNELEPTISDSKNLLDSVVPTGAAM